MVPPSVLEAVSSGCDPYATLARQREVLRRLKEVAEVYLEREQFDDAVATADTAAALAELNHPGVLASPRLEAVLERISRAHLPGAAPASASAVGPEKERVLIVVTETYATGGHTRIVWRWVARDPGRVYSVATTAQRDVMPDGIREAVAASGGQLFDVPAEDPPLARAAALRALAAEADLIVLFDHPYDPVPTLAFAGLRPRPPIVMFNHGDQSFLLGRGIVDVLMCIRREAVEFAARRGFPSDRVLRTPFPVSGPDGHGRDAHEPPRSASGPASGASRSRAPADRGAGRRGLRLGEVVGEADRGACQRAARRGPARRSLKPTRSLPKPEPRGVGSRGRRAAIQDSVRCRPNGPPVSNEDRSYFQTSLI
jgi:hypothetical protein